MIRKFVALAALAASLSGCMLQSKTPTYGDAESELVLGNANGKVRTSRMTNGTWETDPDQQEIAVSGNHYVVRDKSSSVVLNFVALNDSWFVMQAVETGNAAVYMLADVKDGAAEAYPLSCDELKKDKSNSIYVSYEGDDCFIKPDADAKKLFTSLMENAGKAAFRMEILH
jgi:hypothetical protein